MQIQQQSVFLSKGNINTCFENSILKEFGLELKLHSIICIYKIPLTFLVYYF